MATEKPVFRISESAGSFWGTYTALVRNTVIPYQWEALNDRIPGAEPSRAIENFRIAAGLSQGEFSGFVFQDSDVGKWIEAAAWSLETHPDPDLEARVDSVVEILAQAQQPDGYLNTYFQVKEPGKRWTNLTECHELYSAGHLLEGAVAYAEVTGKRAFLEVMLRYVGLIGRTFGTGEGQIRGYDGHEEIELALLKLYAVTRDPGHLALARFFLEERGRSPSFFREEWERRGRISHWSGTVSGPPSLEYHQAHLPVRQQAAAVGHAVRAVYLYTALAGLAAQDQDEDLAQVCRILWSELTGRQMYVTGAIGSTRDGEAFTFAYDLPNDTAYAETCASIGLVFFARELQNLEPRAEYADVSERIFYNTALASMALDGKHFFYVNPQEVWPEASLRNPTRSHVKAVRQPWFGCACCPPNLARLVSSLGRHLFTVRENTLYLDHFITGEGRAGLASGPVTVRLSTAYPYEGRVDIVLERHQPGEFDLALRMPGWCRSWTADCSGTRITSDLSGDGYLHLNRTWGTRETLTLELDLTVEVLEANPLVRENAGKVCLQRGPLVYCFEEADNGPNLSALRLPAGAVFREEPAPDLPAGTVALTTPGTRENPSGWEDRLYRPQGPGHEPSPVTLRAVPYHLWGNRGPGEMGVWLGATRR